ncbi:putative Zinc finger protein [Helianthus anomalus]
MDAQAKKKALYRAKLKAQKQDKRIDSPLVRYNESDQPVCKVCDIVLKSESAWSAHQISAKHREAIKNAKANAAAASRVNNVKPVDSTELNKAKPERPAESNKSQMRPPQAPSQSALPPDFFDKPGKKTKQNETSNAKLVENDNKKKVGSVKAQVAYPFDGDNKRVEASSGTVAEAETVGDEAQASQTGALPAGFFDDKDADLRARGITPVKLDIKDEYKEFEKLIQEDLKEVDNRLEEEEYDAAEMIEEAETVEQKSCRERVEMFKRKKMELKAARSAKRVKDPKVVEKESSVDESSSDDDSDDAVDWRAKHL